MLPVESTLFCPEVIYSLGIRCHTEIFLKKHKYRMFSSVLGSANCKTLEILYDMLKNKFSFLQDRARQVSTNGIRYYDRMNKLYGYRTLINGYDNLKDYHQATLPHHDLTNLQVYTHFIRGLSRLEKIAKLRTPILFIITANAIDDKYFIHNQHKVDLILKELKKTFNAHLLVVIAGYKRENAAAKTFKEQLIVDNRLYKYEVTKNSTYMTTIKHEYTHRESEQELFGNIIQKYFAPQKLLSIERIDQIQIE